MSKTKKIYKYVLRMVKRCEWCEGLGYSVYLNETCGTCNGRGGEWKRLKVLVGEEVTDIL